MKRLLAALLLSLAALAPAAALRAADEPAFSRQEVIYGRKLGTALTMDVLTPKAGANGAGVIVVISGGWYSGHERINDWFHFMQPLLDRGYTVFAVVHGSNPKFSIPEILEDMHRAVRFIRHSAKDYHIDPDRLGITGGSAGGHLSLMQGCGGKDGDPKAADPVDRESSRVQAVAAFCPPTDFLNWGEPGKHMLGTHPVVPVKGAFQFRRLDPKTNSFVEITDEKEREEIGKKISPINNVAKDNPPTLIVHGDKDTLVPLQQARDMAEKLKGAGVTAELIVKEGGGHNGTLVKDHMRKVIEWFDKYLAKKSAP
jgi:acetyl esterase/lipase